MRRYLPELIAVPVVPGVFTGINLALERLWNLWSDLQSDA
jgi:hypothetical protein